MQSARHFPRSNYAILALIGGMAVALSLVSYQYSTYSTNQIIETAVKDIQSTSQRQAHDLSKILINKVEAIDNNLRVVAAGAALRSPSNVEQGKQILSGMQDTTKELTDFYMWLDQDGKIVWISNTTPEQYSLYQSTYLSYRPYFTEPKSTHDLYYSTAIISNDQIPRLYISRPILDDAGLFRGVVVGSVRLDALGEYLQNQIPSDSQGNVGMMDRSGIVLYSSDLTAVGTNVFDDSFQKRLPEDLRPTFNDFLHKSLSGGSGVEDIDYRGTTSTLAYETVNVNGKDFAVMYVTASHTFAGNVLSLIDQQRTFSAVLILIFGAVAVGMALVVLAWNGKLHGVVKSKTSELEEAVTSLQNANEQLKEHDKMQQEFVNIAAHELRTPIQPLIGIVETMQESMKESQTDSIALSNEEIEMLARNAKRLERLTQNILDVTRIENDRLLLDREEFDLNQKILNVVADLVGSSNVTESAKGSDTEFEWQYNKNGSGISIRFSTSQRPLLVNADKTRIFEVVTNILRNALKFTKQGSIEIFLDKGSNNDAIVKIKDSGKGIDQEIVPRLFNKFATKSESGTGLGLYLSKKIVEAHGGKMWAENNTGEQGAAFYFTLPVAKHATEVQTTLPTDLSKDSEK